MTLYHIYVDGPHLCGSERLEGFTKEQALIKAVELFCERHAISPAGVRAKEVVQ